MVEEEPETPPGVRLVVDANLVFSCILRSDGAIGDLLLRSSHLFDLYAPEFLELELTKHRERLLRISKLDEEALDVALSLVLERLTFVNESLISK
jgi:predicted nucleic acid-binding protein